MSIKRNTEKTPKHSIPGDNKTKYFNKEEEKKKKHYTQPAMSIAWELIPFLAL